MLLFDPVRIMVALDELDPNIAPVNGSPEFVRNEVRVRLDRLSFFFKLITFKESEPFNPWRARAIQIDEYLREEISEINKKFPELKVRAKEEYDRRQHR